MDNVNILSVKELNTLVDEMRKRLAIANVGIGLWCKAVNLQTLWRKNDTDRLESKAQGQP
jgi:hypothetical protein